MRDTTYNGWTNYETWAANLWMDNDEGSQAYWREEALRIFEDSSANSITSKSQAARYGLAAHLKETHSEGIPEGVDNSVYGDLLRGALDRVDWSEIADHMLEAALEGREDMEGVYEAKPAPVGRE